jgi:hypothetical protein
MNSTAHRRLSGLIALALVSTATLLAHEEPFGYSRGAQSEAQGEWELTQWATARSAKESGRYWGLDLNTELEYGVTDRFQTAVYLNTAYHFLENSRGSSEAFEDRNQFGINGASFELKYQLLNPIHDHWGFAVYFEPGYGSIEGVDGSRHDEYELETRLILQKNFYDDRLVTVLNYTLEPEFERGADSPWSTNLKMEWTAGASWKLSQRWRVGVETRLATEFSDADLQRASYLVLSAGPTVHYTGDHFFATLTALPQVIGWPDARGVAGLHLDEKEKLEVRLKVGTEF